MYDAWGIVRSTSGSGTSRLGYTGELQDGSLVYLRARWYHTGLGTFTSRDTYQGVPERPQSLHRYGYAENRPTMLVDPSGHDPINPPTPTPNPRCLKEANQQCPSYPTPTPEPRPLPEPPDVARQRLCEPSHAPIPQPSDKGIIIAFNISADTHYANSGIEVDLVYDLYGFGVGIFTGPVAGGNSRTTPGLSVHVSHGLMWGWNKFNPPSVLNFQGVSWALSASLPVRLPGSLSFTYGTSGDIGLRPNFTLQWLMTGIGIDVGSNQPLLNALEKESSWNMQDLVGSLDAGYATPFLTKDFRMSHRKEPVWQNGLDFLLFMQIGMPEPLQTIARPFVLQNMQYWRVKEWSEQ